ncbi:MAG: SIMPL domain-containing protein [Parvularculaceae bacterium]
MLRKATLLSALLLTGCLPQLTQPEIEVDGHATIFAEPDTFTISARIRIQKDKREAALAATAEAVAAVKAAVPELEGLASFKMNSPEASVYPVRDAACMREAYDTSACPIVGQGASVTLEISGSPASLAGNALSFISEFGVESVELEGYEVSNMDARRGDAVKAAVADARAKAEAIAAAAGGTVKGLTRLKSSDYGGYGSEEYDQIVVTASRAPAVPLELDPKPVPVSVNVTAAFALE